MKTLANEIQSLRIALGLSAYRLAALSDLSRSLISGIENAKVPATDDALAKIAPILKVDVGHLKAKRLADEAMQLPVEAQAALAADILSRLSERGIPPLG